MEQGGSAAAIETVSRTLKKEQRTLALRKIKANKGLLVGGFVFLLLLVLVVFGPALTGFDPYEMKVASRLMPPSAEHLMGTDEFGRDLFTRILYGGRSSIGIGVLVAFFSSVFGLAIGVYASYFRVLDHIFMRICDGFVSIPGVLLAIALMAALGASGQNVVIALTIVFTPNIARVVRSGALVVREQPYIEAVRLQGAGHLRTIWGHIVPNVLSPLIVQATFVFAETLLSEAALSFLGAGIPAPAPSWGNILQASKLVIYKAWWMVVFPGLAIILAVFSLNLLGNGLRDLFDPRATRVKKKKRK